jgi:DNA repair protein RadC
LESKQAKFRCGSFARLRQQELGAEKLPAKVAIRKAGVLVRLVPTGAVRTLRQVGVHGWACRVGPRYHVVLAVKVCALAGRALAARGRLRTLTAALRRGAPVSGYAARYRLEFAMSSSSTSAVVAVDALLVRDVNGQCRPARAEEVLSQARHVLSQRVRRGATMSSPQAVKDYLRVEIGALEHEVSCVLFLDAQHRIIALKQMFRGTVTQTSVYPREVVKEALGMNAAAVLFSHNHPRVRSSRAGPTSP